MKQILGSTGLEVSRIGLGCMRMVALESSDAVRVIQTCLENGINFFDHADIYGGGQSEVRFAQAMKELGLDREKLVIQSKCGIRKGFFDFSKEHILDSVDGILSRLQSDYLDLLALHRPDALMEAEEVAEAFRILRESGKVRYFGVSNQNRYQMELLQTYLDEPLMVNQLQLSPAHTPMIDAGFHVNMKDDAATMRDGGILEYCQLQRVTPQAWSPFLISLQEGIFANHPAYEELNRTIQHYADDYGVAAEAIVVAWILRHSAQIQTIVGSMNSERLTKIAQAFDVQLTREQWYHIYRSAGNVLP